MRGRWSVKWMLSLKSYLETTVNEKREKEVEGGSHSQRIDVNEKVYP